ncbi:MAG: hypothetical protein QOK28_2295 [Actinomycetota bacterium]|jgi:hypothetical protein
MVVPTEERGSFMGVLAPELSALSRYDPRLRLNAICPYYTMFPLSFPLAVLGHAAPTDTVLDPFCGRGTTLYAARLLGLAASGVDSNPVAAALAASKLVTVTSGGVSRRCRELLTNGYKPKQVPEGDFWSRCFGPQTLGALCSLREQLLAASETDVTVALRALLLGVLHGPLRVNEPSYLSNQMPRTYASKPRYAVNYWKKNRLKPTEVDVAALVSRRAEYLFSELPVAVAGEVRRGDSTLEISKLRRRYNWTITSPPYYGMRTYLPDQWLRAWFLGGDPSVDYSTEGQLVQSSEDDFVGELASVWRSAAGRSLPNARLVVRFGALPSKTKDPAALLAQSVKESRAGWVIDEIVAAGSPPLGTRQADQMRNGAGDYVEEIDLYATLDF